MIYLASLFGIPFHFFFDFLFAVFFIIPPDIFSDILFGIISQVLSGISYKFLANMFFIILFGILFYILSDTFLHVSSGLKRLKGLEAAASSLAAPRAGLARSKVRCFAAPRAGLARFDGFEPFAAFEGFEGSIRQFRASRKRKPWLATAAGFGTRKGTTSLATASISAYSKSRFGTFQGPSFRSSKSQFGTFRWVWGFWRVWMVWRVWSFWREHPAVSTQ